MDEVNFSLKRRLDDLFRFLGMPRTNSNSHGRSLVTSSVLDLQKTTKFDSI